MIDAVRRRSGTAAARGEQSAADLARRAEALRAALASGGAELESGAARYAGDVAARVGERMALAGDHTIVALAGATGSGKSSLFNRLVGADVAEVGVRRPTTSVARAATWGADDASGLLGWLDVPRRHHVPDGDAALAGLVLLDLPDIDSRVTMHRDEADRVLALADLFAWVTDPQKYADAVLHDQYLRAHRRHELTTLVLLNQVDLLGEADRAVCRDDLERLLREDGFTAPELLEVSARSGLGIDAVRARLAELVAGRGAARRRLAADLDEACERLASSVAASDPDVDASDTRRLVAAIATAAGVPVVADAVRRKHLRDGGRRTRPVFTRWLGALRPDPLKRLRLGTGDAARTDRTLEEELTRTSIPAATPAARAQVDLATRRLVGGLDERLPRPWADAVARAARPGDGDLDDALDRALAATDLRMRDPLWWRLVGALQLLLALAVVVGIAWYLVYWISGPLQFALPDMPRSDGIPYAFALLAGGLALTVLLAAASRWATGIGARRRGARVRRRLEQAVATVSDEHVLVPVRAVLQRHRETREHLAAARR